MKKIIQLSLIALVFLMFSCHQKQSEHDPGSKYSEKYRPQIHFSPEKGWMNDPNGLVYHDGEYHLFYQHHPYSSMWGPMHWGHAVSNDLIHWKHLPIALYPDSLGYIFSGSAVSDSENRSGLGTADNPPLIAFFTYHDPVAQDEGREFEVQQQAVAYSTDNGRSWTKYDNNPVVKNPGIRDFRDPKVVWHPVSERWIMCVAAWQTIRFYSSANLLDWTFESEFGEGYGSKEGVWECPDLFPLKINDTGETKWLLIVNINPGNPAGGTGTQYFVGDFDGTHFTTIQREPLWLDYGKDNYAGVTWSNMPDGRRVLIGWMNNWEYASDQPTMHWSGSATLPRELGLRKVRDNNLLTSRPVAELRKLYGKSNKIRKLKVNGSRQIFEGRMFVGSPVEIELTFDVSEMTRMDFPGKFGLRLSNRLGEHYTIGYDNIVKYYYADRTHATSEDFSPLFSSMQYAPYLIESERVTWKIILDWSSVEWFASDGDVVITNLVYPTEHFDTLELFTEEGWIDLPEAKITQLTPIW